MANNKKKLVQLGVDCAAADGEIMRSRKGCDRYGALCAVRRAYLLPFATAC